MVLGPSGEELISYRKSNLSPGENSIAGEKILASIETPLGKLATAICADFNFSRFIRGAGADKVDVIFDSASEWPEIAKIQTAAALFRTVENGFNLVKSTSGGVSITANHQGKIISKSGIGDSVLIADVPSKGVSTFFSRSGWWFPFICLGIFILITLIKFRRWRRLLVVQILD